MKSKEKALELYNKFSNTANSFIEGKRCALLCVEEILDLEITAHQINYWQDVKNELKKL